MGVVNIAGPVRVRPEPYGPYHPATRPWYLDAYWRFFVGRAFRTGQVATSTTLFASVAASTTAMTITGGAGGGVAVGDALVIFEPATSNPLNYQVLHVNSVGASGANTLVGVNPAFKANFTAGATVQALWSNDAHLTSWSHLAQFISDARRTRSLVGTNLLGTVGDMLASYTDARGKTSVPLGWESIGPATFITSTYAYAAGNIANARQGNGIHITPVAVGGGIRTLKAIPVTAGEMYEASLLAKAAASGTSFYLSAVDKATSLFVADGVTTNASAAVSSATGGFTAALHEGAAIVGPNITNGTTVARVVDTNNIIMSAVAFASGTALALSLGKELGRSQLSTLPEFQGASGSFGQLVCRYTVPVGVSNVELRVQSTITGGAMYFDDCRLLHERQPSTSDRYVIEYDPAGAVLLSDSWGVLGLNTLLPAALAARMGRSMPFTTASVGGNRLDQMIARFYTDVLPYKPRYCIHGSGFANDQAQPLTQAQFEANTDTFIDLCRSNGIVPVMLGVAPLESQITNSPVRNDQVRARVDLAAGALPLLVGATAVDA